MPGSFDLRLLDHPPAKYQHAMPPRQLIKSPARKSQMAIILGLLRQVRNHRQHGVKQA
jgi:hypothetical protein